MVVKTGGCLIQQAVVAKSDVVANNKKNSTLIFKMLLSIDNLKQTWKAEAVAAAWELRRGLPLTINL